MYYSFDSHSSTYRFTIICWNSAAIIRVSEREPIIPNYKPYQKPDPTLELSNWSSRTQTELCLTLCRLGISGSDPRISTELKWILFHISSEGILWLNYSVIRKFLLDQALLYFTIYPYFVLCLNTQKRWRKHNEQQLPFTLTTMQEKCRYSITIQLRVKIHFILTNKEVK